MGFCRCIMIDVVKNYFSFLDLKSKRVLVMFQKCQKCLNMIKIGIQKLSNVSKKCPKMVLKVLRLYPVFDYCVVSLITL